MIVNCAYCQHDTARSIPTGASPGFGQKPDDCDSCYSALTRRSHNGNWL
jgi:hypothetical protein